MDNRLNKQKIIETITNTISNIKSNTNYTSQEYKNFCDLKSTFCYLLMFPETLRLQNLEEIEKICNEGKFYNKMYLKGTLEFENLKNKYPQMLRSLDENGVFVTKQNEGDLLYEINLVYEKKDDKDDIVYEYYQFAFKEEGKANVVDKNKGFSFEFPSFIRGEKRLDLMSNPKTIKLDNNRYRITINCMFNYFNLGKKQLKTIQIDYIDYDKCLVFQDFFDTKYSEYKNFENIFNKMVVVGENEGNLFVLNGWKPNSVFHAMRMALAHNPKFNYNIKLNDYVSLIGKMLITNEKRPDDRLKHFNRVLLLDTGVFNHISYLGNIDDAVIQDDTFNFVYVPSITQNCKDFDEMFSKCAFLTVKFANKINTKYATTLIEDLLIRNSNNRVVEIAPNIISALSKKGLKAEVTSGEIKNKEILRALLTDQLCLIGKNEKQGKKFEKYLTNILNFYDYKSLANNEHLIRKYGDTIALKIDNLSVIKIMSYFQDLILANTAQKNNKNCKVDECNYNERELHFVLAYFYSYISLIDNCFAEHLSNDVKKAVDIAQKTDFSKFEMINIVDGVQSNIIPQSKDEKIEVIKFIRNCIAHSNMFVELSKTGLTKESTVVFKNLKYRDKIVKIKIEDYLAFLTNENFLNYSVFEDDEIEAKSFEDLLGKAKTIIKKAKNYIFD